MSEQIIKVGPKGKHVSIPSGWMIVKSGKCLSGDMYLNLHKKGTTMKENESLRSQKPVEFERKWEELQKTLTGVLGEAYLGNLVSFRSACMKAGEKLGEMHDLAIQSSETKQTTEGIPT